jgi:hypothetical protein
MKNKEQQKPETIKEDEVDTDNHKDPELDTDSTISNVRRLRRLRIVLAKALSEGRAPTDEELGI